MENNQNSLKPAVEEKDSFSNTFSTIISIIWRKIVSEKGKTSSWQPGGDMLSRREDLFGLRCGY